MMMPTKQRRNTIDLKCPLGNPSVERTWNSSVHPINKSTKCITSEGFYCNISNLQLLLWIVLVSCFSEHSFGETSKPLNRWAAKGDTVQLNCSTQEPENGYWKYKRPFEGNWRRIYDGDKVINGMKGSFYVNDSVQGSFNLIFNANTNTSGRYTCEPDVTLTDQSAEVIVFDTSPRCSKTVTADSVNAKCLIDFSGNWAPKIVWHNMNERLEANDTITIPNHRVTSFLIVPFNQTDILTCTPMFALEDKPQETTATNVPDQLNNCTLIIESPSDISSTLTTTATTSAPPPPPPLYIIGIVFACIFVTVSIIVIFYNRKAILRKTCTRRPQKESRLEVMLM